MSARIYRKNTFYQHHTRDGLYATPHNDNHSESSRTSTNRSERNEDRFCPQLVKDGTLSAFHAKNRDVIFTSLSTMVSLEESKPHWTVFYSQLNHTGISRGGSKSIHSNCRIRGKDMRVSLMLRHRGSKCGLLICGR